MPLDKRTPSPRPAHRAGPNHSAVPSGLRRVVFHRPLVTAACAGAVVFALLVAGVSAANVAADADPGAVDPAGQWQPGLGPTPTPSVSAAPASPEGISMSATGDIILGTAGSLPPNDGEGFFDGVADALAADLVTGNLEQPLTGDTGHDKCGDSKNCFAFRAPPRYAAHLRDAGFELLNLANNHGDDFGPEGRTNTQAALDQNDLAHTGELDEFAVVEVEGVSVAVVGFSPYDWTNSLTDLQQAGDVVGRAAQDADVVVVQAHMGAEGADATRVTPGVEEFFGENRGDPVAFSRAVIDAGADLVVGHGPHVLRGLEFYEGRLIAYSLGNFAGGGSTLNSEGTLGLGAVLKVTLQPDGSFVGGELVSTHMYDAGLPKADSKQRSLALVRDLTERDFPETGARLDSAGEITEP